MEIDITKSCRPGTVRSIFLGAIILSQAEVRLEQIERKLKRGPVPPKEYQEVEECPQRTAVPFIMCLIMS